MIRSGRVFFKSICLGNVFTNRVVPSQHITFSCKYIVTFTYIIVSSHMHRYCDLTKVCVLGVKNIFFLLNLGAR